VIDLLADNFAALLVAAVSLGGAVINNRHNLRRELIKIQAAEGAAHNADVRIRRIDALEAVMVALTKAHTKASNFARPDGNPLERSEETWIEVLSLRETVGQKRVWLPADLADKVNELTTELWNAASKVQFSQIPAANKIQLWGEAWDDLDGRIRISLDDLETAIRGELAEKSSAVLPPRSFRPVVGLNQIRPGSKRMRS